MNGYLARLERMRAWDGTASHGLAAARSSIEMTDTFAASVAFVETLYPEGAAGQEILDAGVDPEKVDAWRALPPALTLLSKRLDAMQSSGFQRHLSHRANPTVFRSNEIEQGSWGNKPASAIYTSTADASFPGMWFSYLSARDTSENVHSWRVENPDEPGLVIRSAVDWCDFSLRFSGGNGEIEWADVAEQYSTVSLTAIAVARIDCFEFTYDDAVIAPAFWGVEATVWLRAGVLLVDDPDWPR